MEEVLRIVTQIIPSVDSGNLNAAMSQINKSLGKVKMGEGTKGLFNNLFQEYNSVVKKINEKLQSGIKFKDDPRAYNSLTKNLKKVVSEISENWDKVRDLQMPSLELVSPDLDKQIKDLTKSINTYEQKIKEAKVSTKDFQKIQAEANTTKLTKSAENAKTEIFTNVQKGNLEKALQLLDEAIRKRESLANKEGQPGLDKRQQSMAATAKANIKYFEDLKQKILQAALGSADFNQELKNLESERAAKVAEAFRILSGESEDAAKKVGDIKKAYDSTENSIDEALDKQKHFNESISSIKNRITDFFSLTNSIYLVRRALQKTINDVKTLDAAMTETAVVTDFSVGDMWNMLPQYTRMAKDLGATTEGVYDTLTLFYQQGLDTNEAMSLGVETLKMAGIAGMNYEEATQRMTAALRGFNMELNKISAKRVNDVYSELAAITAADTDQISQAMTKTASIAKSANMEFETTAAFLSQIIETTQEAPETAGTAMKTVIARFTQVKDNPNGKNMVDGEVVDINKIDEALRSIGVALKGVDGQLRPLDQVFLEISKKWHGLDSNTQHYIATIAAGSRQQSRFIAMMQDYDRTMELVTAANESAGSADEQFAKKLDSLEAKLNRLNDSWQEFSLGLTDETVVKGLIDFSNGILQIINTLTNLPGPLGVASKGLLAFSTFFVGKKFASALTTSVVSQIQSIKDNGATAAITFRDAFLGEFSKTKDALKEMLHGNSDLLNNETFVQREFKGATIKPNEVGGALEEAASGTNLGWLERSQERLNKKEHSDYDFINQEYEKIEEKKSQIKKEIEETDQIIQRASEKGKTGKTRRKRRDNKAAADTTIKNQTAHKKNLTEKFQAAEREANDIKDKEKNLTEAHIKAESRLNKKREEAAKAESVLAQKLNITNAQAATAIKLKQQGVSTETALALAKQGLTATQAREIAIQRLGVALDGKEGEEKEKLIRLKLEEMGVESTSLAGKIKAKLVSIGTWAAKKKENKERAKGVLLSGAETVATEGENAVDGVQLKITIAQRIAEALKNKEMMIGLAIVLAVILAVALLAKGVSLLIKAYQEEENRLANLVEQEEKLKKAYDDAGEAAENFKEQVNSYETAQKNLENFTGSVEEYKRQIEEANNQSKELIKTYGLFDDYTINKDGLIKIDEEALKKTQNQLYQKEALAKENYYSAKIETDQEKLERFEREEPLRGGIKVSKEVHDRSGKKVGTYQSNIFREEYLRILDLISNNSIKGPDDAKELIENEFPDLKDEFNSEELTTLINQAQERDKLLDNIKKDTEKIAEGAIEKKYGSQFRKAATNEETGEFNEFLYNKLLGFTTKIKQQDEDSKITPEEIKDIKEKAKSYADNGFFSSHFKEDFKKRKYDFGDYISDKEVAMAYAKEFGGLTDEQFESVSYDSEKHGKGTITYLDNGETKTIEIDDDAAKVALADKFMTEEREKELVEGKPEAEEIITAAEALTTDAANGNLSSDLLSDILTISSSGKVSGNFLSNFSKEQIEKMKVASSNEELFTAMGLNSDQIKNAENIITAQREAFNLATVLNEKTKDESGENLNFYDRYTESTRAEYEAKENREIFQNAERFGINSEDLVALADSLSDSEKGLKDNRKAALALSQATIRLNRGAKEINKNWKDWSKSLNSSNKGTDDYVRTLKNLKKATADMLNLDDVDHISDEFIEKNSEKIASAAKGDAKTLKEIRFAAADDILKGVIERNKNLVDNEGHTLIDNNAIDEAKNNLESFKKYLETLEPNSKIDEKFIEQLNNMAKKTKMAKEEMQAMLGGLGVDATVKSEPEEIETTEYLPQTTYTVSASEDDGGYTLTPVASESVPVKSKRTIQVASIETSSGTYTSGGKISQDTINTGAPSGGSSKKHSNKHDKAYNVNKKIEGQQQSRNKYEYQYNKILREEFGNLDEIRKNQELRKKSLEEEVNLVKERIRIKKDELKIFQEENKKYSEYAWYDPILGQVQIDWDKLENIKDSDFGEKVDNYISELEKLVETKIKSDEELRNLDEELYELTGPGELNFDIFTSLLNQIEQTEREINNLGTELELLNLSQKENSKEIYENYVKQRIELEKQLELNKQLFNDSQKEIERILADPNVQPFLKYVFFNDLNNTLTFDEEAINNLTQEEQDAFSNFLDKLQQVIDQNKEANDSLNEIVLAEKERVESLKESTIDFVSYVRGLVVEKRQEEIDLLSQIDSSINESNSKILNEVKENLAFQRQVEQNKKQEENLENKITQLNYLKMDTSGANDLAIKKLEKEINEQSKSYTDQLVDQKLDALDKQNQKGSEERQKIIRILEAQLALDQIDGTINSEIDELIKEGVDENGLKKDSPLFDLIKNSNDFSILSQLEINQRLLEIKGQIATLLTYQKEDQQLGQEGSLYKAGTDISDKFKLPERAATVGKNPGEVDFHLKDGTVKTLSGFTDSVLSGSIIHQNGLSLDQIGELYNNNFKGNNSFTALDARKALRASVKLEQLSDEEKKRFDLNHDNLITADDAREILRYGVNLSTGLNGLAGKEIHFMTKDFSGNGIIQKDGTVLIKGKNGESASFTGNGYAFSDDYSELFFDQSLGGLKIPKSKKNTQFLKEYNATKNENEKRQLLSKYFGLQVLSSDELPEVEADNSLKSTSSSINQQSTEAKKEENKKDKEDTKQLTKGQKVKASENAPIYSTPKDQRGVSQFFASSSYGENSAAYYLKNKVGSRWEVSWAGLEGKQKGLSSGWIEEKDLKAFKTGGLADFTGPAWLDGTKSRPEIVLNQKDTQNFIQLKDVLSSLLNRNNNNSKDNSQPNGDNYYEIHLNVEKITSDYDVESLANKIKDIIAEDANSRGVNSIYYRG